MLVLKIIFGIIVTLPILILAEYLFENTVADAVVGTSKKKKKPLMQRLFPWLGRKKKKKRTVKDNDNIDNNDITDSEDNINNE